MRQAVQRRQLVADHVRRPVLRHAHTDHVVQGQRRRKHVFRHRVVIALVRQRFGSDFDHRMQDAFGPAVHQPRLMGRSHILLQHMHESIRKSAGYLTLRQRIERLGIEDREDRIIAVESIFFLGLVARNDRPGVHLGTRGRHGEDRSQRHGLAGLPLEHDVPCIAVVEKARSDEFRTVDDRPAADSLQEVHLPLFAQRNGFAQGLDRRIRLDAPELDQVAAFECGRDGLLLDRGGGRVAFFGHGTLEWFYQVQFLECHCISVLSRRRAPDNSVLIIYGGKNGKRQTNAHYYWHKGTINSAILVHLD